MTIALDVLSLLYCAVAIVEAVKKLPPVRRRVDFAIYVVIVVAILWTAVRVAGPYLVEVPA